MPIIQHNVQAALRQAGIVKDPDAEQQKSIEDILDEEGLSLRETISCLSDVVKCADTSASRKSAIDTALKLRGVLKEQAPAPPSFHIVFTSPNDRPEGQNGEIKINPILVPRPRKVA